MRIRQNGLPVYGFGATRTPEGFRQACTRFIDLTAVVEPTVADAPTPKREIDEELVKVLGDAWKASKRDEQGYATLSELGQRATNRSSFDARSYGFERLSDLIGSLPNFAIKREEGHALVKRVR
jgi:hypothetical protein